MTEFIFLTMIMLPLFFGIPMIGKLIDLKQTAVQASRYAAWESTVHSGSEPAFVQDRFFGDSHAAISSSPTEAGQNSLWGDSPPSLGISEKSAVRLNETSVSVTTGEAKKTVSPVARTIGSIVRSAGNAIGSLSDGNWDLQANGMVESTLTLEVQANDWVSESLSTCGTGTGYGCLSESAVIMTDGWSAGNDAQAENRVKSLVPASSLHEVGKLVSNVGRIPLFKELRDIEDAFGYVAMQPLPQSEKLSRYKEYEQ